MKSDQETQSWDARLGRPVTPEERLLLDHVCNVAMKSGALKRVLLFGSRARGNHTRRSDFDFALQWFPVDARMRHEVLETISEESPTVHAMDLVDLEEAGPELRQSIEKDGKEIYSA